MKIYYSAATSAFYNTSLHGDRLPKDCVEISAEEHQALMDGQSKGHVIVANGNGFPVLSDPPKPTNDELKARCKEQAKRLLADSDWSQQADVAVVLNNKEEFDAYRAAVRGLFLRPVPEPIWPDEPEADWSA